jgi:hypothetical protein
MKQRAFCICLCLLLVLSPVIAPKNAFGENGENTVIPIIEPASNALTLNWTQLSPCPDRNQVLGLALEDKKETESDLFKLIILDSTGNILSQTWDIAVSAAYWLDSDNILYFSHDSIEMNSGKGIIWNLINNNKTLLLPQLTGGYQATCWDVQTRRLLFAVTESSGECVLYEITQPVDARQTGVRVITALPFAPYRIFFAGTNSESLWIEHPETHSLYFIV